MNETEQRLKELLDAALQREKQLLHTVFVQKGQLENLRYEVEKLRGFLSGTYKQEAA